jgi:monofunctional biosynthetic peptidoglycan transglycosylase
VVLLNLFPFTPLMLIRVIENKTAGKDAILSHDWEPIENISVNLKGSNSK